MSNRRAGRLDFEHIAELALVCRRARSVLETVPEKPSELLSPLVGVEIVRSMHIFSVVVDRVDLTEHVRATGFERIVAMVHGIAFWGHT